MMKAFAKSDESISISLSSVGVYQSKSAKSSKTSVLHHGPYLVRSLIGGPSPCGQRPAGVNG